MYSVFINCINVHKKISNAKCLLKMLSPNNITKGLKRETDELQDLLTTIKVNSLNTWKVNCKRNKNLVLALTRSRSRRWRAGWDCESFPVNFHVYIITIYWGETLCKFSEDLHMNTTDDIITLHLFLETPVTRNTMSVELSIPCC